MKKLIILLLIIGYSILCFTLGEFISERQEVQRQAHMKLEK
ncbi:hypothetical protein [Clostridium tarantellae]|nr:hypothetical protein [Clostridium tarantellae]